jgi:hypothetical protein
MILATGQVKFKRSPLAVGGESHAERSAVCIGRSLESALGEADRGNGASWA